MLYFGAFLSQNYLYQLYSIVLPKTNVVFDVVDEPLHIHHMDASICLGVYFCGFNFACKKLITYLSWGGCVLVVQMVAEWHFLKRQLTYVNNFFSFHNLNHSRLKIRCGVVLVIKVTSKNKLFYFIFNN